MSNSSSSRFSSHFIEAGKNDQLHVPAWSGARARNGTNDTVMCARRGDLPSGSDSAVSLDEFSLERPLGHLSKAFQGLIRPLKALYYKVLKGCVRPLRDL